MSSITFRSLVFALVVLALSLARGLAQEGGLRELETDFEKKDRLTRALRNSLFKGEKQANPLDKAHQEAIEVAAKEVTYPLHWRASERKMGKLNGVVEAFEGSLSRLDRTKNRAAVAAFQRLFCKAVAEYAKEVVIAGPNIAAVNAARILYLLPARRLDRGLIQPEKEWAEDVRPRLAGDTAETLAAIYAELVTSPRVNDGAKYYLLRGMADLLALPRQPSALLKKETENKLVLAAMPVLKTKKVFALNTPREELEGWKMLRAQALRVLAQGEATTLGKEQPALNLAQAAGNDSSIVPPVRIDERIEGAIGLARLVAQGKSADLSADYAAHQVASAVAGFALDANQNIGAKAAIRVRPWKADAARLMEAVESMAASKDPHVTAVVAQCRPILSRLEAGEVAPASTDLQDWVRSNPPAAKSLLKSDPASTIKPYAPKE